MLTKYFASVDDDASVMFASIQYLNLILDSVSMSESLVLGQPTC